jgi:hypothetical protein
MCCSYVDKWRYLESGQEKKKGFLTSDFSKRDEFSNTTRTLQWREQLAVSTHFEPQSHQSINQCHMPCDMPWHAARQSMQPQHTLT